MDERKIAGLDKYKRKAKDLYGNIERWEKCVKEEQRKTKYVSVSISVEIYSKRKDKSVKSSSEFCTFAQNHERK